jgi:hypothetical protein
MYLMVYSTVAHIEMCSDGTSMVDELAAGNMPHSAQLVKDPFPLWKPPTPDTKLEKVRWLLRALAVSMLADGVP